MNSTSQQNQTKASPSIANQTVYRLEEQALLTLREHVDVCAVPADLISELLERHGVNEQDPGMLRVIALGLQ